MRHLAPALVILLFSFLLLSCKPKVRIHPEEVESITFYAMPKGVEFSHSIVSFQALKRAHRDTLIMDRDFIQQFSTMINVLTPDRTVKSMDMRSAAVIATKTGDSLFVAFGEKWGTAILRDHGKDKSPFHVNGAFMKDNPDLFRFIDEHVYNPHSNDYWLNDEERSFLRWIRKADKVVEILRSELINAVIETIDFEKEQGEYLFPELQLCAGIWFDFRGEADSVYVLGGPMTPLFDKRITDPEENFIGYYEGKDCLISVASLGKQDNQTIERFINSALLSEDKDAYKIIVDKYLAPLSDRSVCAYYMSSFSIEPNGKLTLKSRRLRR